MTKNLKVYLGILVLVVVVFGGVLFYNKSQKSVSVSNEALVLGGVGVGVGVGGGGGGVGRGNQDPGNPDPNREPVPNRIPPTPTPSTSFLPLTDLQIKGSPSVRTSVSSTFIFSATDPNPQNGASTIGDYPYIATFLIDWGDGSPMAGVFYPSVLKNGVATASVTRTKYWAQSGTYTVTFTVGISGKNSKPYARSTPLFSKTKMQVTVSNDKPSIVITNPSAGTVFKLGNTYEITWTGSNPGVTGYSVYLGTKLRNPVGARYIGWVDASKKSFTWSIPSGSTIPVYDSYQIQLSGSPAGSTGDISAIGDNSDSFTIAAQ